MEIDYERWLNELRHKYLAIVQQAYSVCWKTVFLSELQCTYDMIMYGREPYIIDDAGKQLPRKRSNVYLTAKEELDEFMTQK